MRRALILASVFVLAACNMAADAQEGALGSGPMTQRGYQLAGFTGISVAGPHDVIVRVGPAHSVRAEGPADVLEKLEVKLDGRNLEIGMKKGSWRLRGKTVIHVTMPAIESAAIAGSGDIRIDRVQGGRFAASIGGSGDIEVAALEVGEASFSVAGSGNIRASGRAERSSVSIAGSGDVDLSAVEAQTASVSIVGSGEVRARAMKTADVSIMGSGDVDLTGPARCSVSKMGSGNVRCGGG
jgi:hypothetical protein